MTFKQSVKAFELLPIVNTGRRGDSQCNLFSWQLNHNCEDIIAHVHHLTLVACCHCNFKFTAKMALSHEIEFLALLSLSPSVQLRQSTRSVQSIQLTHTAQSTTTHELEASSKSRHDTQQ